MSVVKQNIAANFLGNGLTALLALVLIPLYIKFLGVEAWGVIGIFATLQSLAYILDFGLSSNINREMARLSLQEENVQEMHDLVHTVELIYWGIAAVVGITVFGLASVIANHWVHASQLSPDTIQHAIRLMALALFLQCSFTFYSGGLMGLQRQVLLSGLNVTIATIRGLGAVLIVWELSATLQAFFLWQIAINLIQAFLTRWFLWRSLPKEHSTPRFRKELLSKSWRFAAGVSGATILSLIVSQIDKVVLSRFLSLEMFGYYVLASSVATSLYLFTVPVFFAVYPRLTQLLSLGEQHGLKEIYHRGCQLISVLIIPITLVIAFFSKEILMLWTGNSTTVANTHSLLSILVVGTSVSALMQLPNALQLAFGWIKLCLYLNIFSVVVLTPSIVLVASAYGAEGVALLLVSFNATVALVSIQVMHGRILRGEEWRWYLSDVGLPLGVSLGATLFCRILMPTDMPRFQLLMTLASISLVVIGATALATPVTRETLVSFIRSGQGRVLKTS